MGELLGTEVGDAVGCLELGALDGDAETGAAEGLSEGGDGTLGVGGSVGASSSSYAG